MKYIINIAKDGAYHAEALYKGEKLVMFDSKEQAEPVASALDGEVVEVVHFGDDWISKDHFEQIDHTDLMDIFSEIKEKY